MRTNDLYYDYPYRKNTEGLTGSHYVPVKEVSDHKFALTKKEWKLIVDVFFTYLVMLLINGQQVSLINNFGSLRLRKRKIDKPFRSQYARCVYYVRTKLGVRSYKEAKRVVSEQNINVKWFNKDTNNHQISLVWTPHKNTKCSFLWKVWLPKNMYLLLFKYFSDNKKALDNLLE